jgi:RHS repeat-associated protein
MIQAKSSGESSESQKTFSAPSISLPKGGGAIRGIGEKFASNPVTGTGSMTVPIATSPGRSGFGPQLALSYDSGSGNGPFGFGWSLSLPCITRKTDKGLPRYNDAEESDVYILSGSEDLVPVLGPDAKRFEDSTSFPGYTVHRYRPRIEGLFVRIERWTHRDTGVIHWRSISRDNVTTLYGKDNNSRIFDPSDPHPDRPARIFSWLICESYDDKGNAIVYEYSPEDSRGVELTQVNERNRTPKGRGANRYLKRVKYGNTVSRLLPGFSDTKWLFEVVFDYGEGHLKLEPLDAEGRQTVHAHLSGPVPWPARPDPFSSYRAGFEIRTYRLCEQILMVHHFKDELKVDDYLVSSTIFVYQRSTAGSFLTKVMQCGYVAWPVADYPTDLFLQASLPPVEFEYSQAVLSDEVREIDEESLQNLPVGLDGSNYQWVDLDGEGLSGILTEQAESWFYKRNLGNGRFGPLERVPQLPVPADLGSGRQRLLDLSADGQLDLTEFAGPTPGFHPRTTENGWDAFIPFASLPQIDWGAPNVRFADLTGDGHADVLITEESGLRWHASLAEEGFGAEQRVLQPFDEEFGPRLLFADGTQSVYLADLSGDGLSDLLRIRSGEVSYWPNLGYGRFGPRVTMDDSPCFEHPDLFDRGQIRLVDIDGSGTTDIIYLERGRVTVYRNQSGNRWGPPETLASFPRVDDLSTILATDLLGNGTACLVWGSALPGDARQPLRFIDLMADGKPHLLTVTRNNLGAETRVHYVSSTKFYLADGAAGRPWITKLPFPVHVVERVETWDRVSGNRLVSSYTYHHGYFDGEEREFRGFGMVEQMDAEEFAALRNADDADHVFHVPPVLTKTWFHTGAYLARDTVSNFFAGLVNSQDRGEYYREPAWRDNDAEARKQLLDDTALPTGLAVEEEREACRALKGAMLRQEVYALDGGATDDYPHGHPYIVTEQNFGIKVLQLRGARRHGVFFTHPREAIKSHYERNPTDPRVRHTLTLEVDGFGNVLKEVVIGYGRRIASSDPEMTQGDHAKQSHLLITCTQNGFTLGISGVNNYRTPLPAETRTYEITGFRPENNGPRFTFAELIRNEFEFFVLAAEIPYHQAPDNTKSQKRLIEHTRTVYRKDDLTALLPVGAVEPMALAGETYKLLLVPELLARIFKRKREGQPDEELLPAAAVLLEGKGQDQGGFVRIDGNWWIPSGRIFFDPLSDVASPASTAPQEYETARGHFFVPRKLADPFGHGSVADYDPNDLLVVRTCDPLGNTVTASNDLRVLKPTLVTDPNLNRTAVAVDALGLVVATAVMGKEGQNVGDLLEGFDANPPLTGLQGFIADPRGSAAGLLGRTTTRFVYDLGRYARAGQAAVAATLSRETYFHTPGGLETKIHLSFTYSDGFGREVQKKIQAEPGDAPQRQAPIVQATGDLIPGHLMRDSGGGIVPAKTTSRWVGSGRTVFNNKGKPVRQYEPFFSATHLYEPERDMTDTGVSAELFYDPVERVVATLHPNHTYEKTLFNAWHRVSYDVNDTVAAGGSQTGDPRTDPDIAGYVREYFKRQPADWKTWHAQRIGNPTGHPERDAAEKAAAHADTPTISQLDTLGRPFLTLADNGPDLTQPGRHLWFGTRIELDIEGNQRAVSDTKGRVVMRYDYDMLGNRIHEASIEAGERWMLNDASGKPIRSWDSRGHTVRTQYDSMRRPIRSFVSGIDPGNPTQELLTERLVYGEQHPENDQRNLRTKLYLHLDQAGSTRNEAYDFTGNRMHTSRRLSRRYKQAVDWQVVDKAAIPPDASTHLGLAALEAALGPHLETDSYTNRTTYDALNRPLALTVPDSSVIRPRYNEANLLEGVDVNLRGAETLTPFVTNIDYDAEGRRTMIGYATTDGVGIATTYRYDPDTSRLVHLKTSRNSAGFNGTDRPGEVQNLRYTYDPAGNITHIRDDAQQTIYFNGQVVEPHAYYTYDPTYRLIAATGREHIGQAGQPETSWSDEPRSKLTHPHDGQGMRSYRENYQYDDSGNFEKVLHQAINGNWTRTYTYNEPSQLEPGKKSNRLSGSAVGRSNNTDGSYRYDAHGNMIRMPHLANHPDPAAPNLHWDYKDQLQQIDKVVGASAYYVYDAGGQRVRKMWEKAPGVIEERIYLGVFEIFRRRDAAGAVSLTRETLHIMGDKERVAIVETRTQGDDPAPAQLTRYHLGNHLRSVSLELDQDARVVSYEEYTPYGSTAYQAVHHQLETPKRYRYTGKERDEESGLYFSGARYYAPWLGRWTRPDPAELIDGVNRYSYTRNNPLRGTDPTGAQTQDETRPSPVNQVAPVGAPDHGTGQSDGRSHGGSAQIGAGIASSAPAMIEGAIWNKTFLFEVSDSLQGTIWRRRGNALEFLAGNNRWQGGLHLAENADRLTNTSVIQIKSTTQFTKIGQVTRDATWDAAQYMVDHPTIAKGRLPQAHIIVPSGTPNRVVNAAENALATARKPLPGRVTGRAPIVTRGLPVGRTLNVAGKVLGAAGGAFSAYSLVEDYKRGDVASGVGNASGVVSSAATLAAPIIGTTAGAVTGAFAIGYGAGTLINDHVLSEDTKDAIGGTLNEIINEGGWKELFKHPFGIGM